MTKTDSAESFEQAHDRKVNGPKGYKTTSRTVAVAGGGSRGKDHLPQRLVSKTFWRIATDFAPAFAMKVTYHG